MDKTEFIDKLRRALNGNISPSMVQDNVSYYKDYIDSEIRKGKTEKEVMDMLGDPRLIARTLLDTDVDNGQLDYEEYSTYSDDVQNTQSSGHNHVHVWRFDTWYSKLLGVVILLIVVFLLFHILVAVIPFFAVLALILFIVSLIKNRN